MEYMDFFTTWIGMGVILIGLLLAGFAVDNLTDEDFRAIKDRFVTWIGWNKTE